MRFKCRKEALQEALSLLCSIVPSRSTKPIIQNIRVEGLENNIIEMCATDLDVGLRYTLEVNELSDPEAVILPSMELSSIVRDAWGESITIEVTDNQANVITEGAKFRLPGESADEFPTIPAIDEEIATEIRAEDMSIAIGQTLFATAREDHQYSLAGVYINLEGKKMEMVTTDTFRLALSTKPLHKEVEKATSAIVLAKGMHELSRLLDGEEMVSLQVSDSHFFARTSRATLVSRLIEGKFPQYRNVIPKDLDKTITVKRVRFNEALRQAAHVANKETRAVNLVAHDNILEIKATSAHGGEAHIEIDATIEGGEVAVSFNYTYLVDVIKILSEEDITLSVRDRESPARIDMQDYTYLVSPVCNRTGS